MTMVLPSRRLPIAEDAIVRIRLGSWWLELRAESVRRNRFDVRRSGIRFSLLGDVLEAEMWLW
jgi:hypothetical protein